MKKKYFITSILIAFLSFISTNYNIIYSQDKDSDGIANSVDLDDDNDGILDTDEACSSIEIQWNHNDSGGQGQAVTYGTSPDASVFFTNANDLSFGSGIFENPDYPFTYIFSGADQATFVGAKNNNDYIQVAFTPNSNLFITEINFGYFTGDASHIEYNMGNHKLALEISTNATDFSTANVLIQDLQIGAMQAPNGYAFFQNAVNDYILLANTTYYVRVYFYDEQNTDPQNRIRFDDFYFNMNAGCDPDGDGLINSLDTDSDGDGCYDAIEAAGSFTISDLDAEGKLTGGVDANGVPAIANGGQANTIAVTDSLDTTACPPDADGDGVPDSADICSGFNDLADNDGDSIPDGCDLDDDNDGILDCDEKGLLNSEFQDIFSINGNAVQTAPNEVRLTQNLNNQSGQAFSFNTLSFYEDFNFSFEANLGTDDFGADGIAIVFHNDPAGSAVIGQNGQGMGAGGIANGIVLEIDTWDNGAGLNDIPNDHTSIWDSDNQAAGNISPAVDFGNLENGNWHLVNVSWNANTQTLIYTLNGVLAGSYTGDLINSYFGGSGYVYFGFTASTGGAVNNHSVRFTDFCNMPVFIDTDGDTLPNHLDTDGDGDGCYDALEGNGTFTPSDIDGSGALTGSVDANGVPTAANGGQANSPATTDSSNFTACDSDNDGIFNTSDICPGFNDLADNDGDSIPDGCDQDDDNDGIKDVDEYCQIANSFSGGNGGSTFNFSYTNAIYAVFDFDFVDNSIEVQINGTPVYTTGSSGTMEFQTSAYNSAIEGLFRFQDNTSPETIWLTNIQGLPRVRIIVDEAGNVQVLGTRNTNSTSLELMTPDQGFYNTISWVAGANNITIINPDDDNLDGFQGISYGYSACDTDNDSIPDYFDTDSDNDGCPDAIEGAASFTQSDLDADNSLGDTVDANGIPTIASGGQASSNAVRDNSDTSSCNSLPIANDDSLTVDQNSTAGITNQVDVSTNDIIGNDGGDGDDYALNTGATNGVVVEVTDGIFEYVPNFGFVGTDSFTYTLTDANGDVATAIVNITVNAVNDTPTAAADNLSVEEDSTAGATNQIDVSTNDNIGGDGGDGDDYSLTTPPTNGNVTEVSDGVFEYIPNANFNGNDSFTYTLTDANGDSTTAIVNVTVNATNDAPVATDDVATGSEDAPIVIDVLANDSDIDSTIDPASVSISSAPANGTVTIDPATGEVTYTPNADFNGNDSFEYTVCDDATPALCDTAIVNVTVNATNDTPVATDDNTATNEDIAVTINVLANDSDIDSTIDPASVSISSAPANGTVTIDPATGEVTYTPNADFNGNDSFEYTVCDDATPALCDTAIVNVTVNAVNDAPVATDDNAATNEDTAFTINVLANDSDIDSTIDPASVSISSAPANGTVTIDPATGEVTYTPNPDFNGNDSFEYTVCDDATPALCDTAIVNVTVNATNDAPVATDDNAATNEDIAVTINVLANDSDIDSTIDPASVSISSAPANGTVTIDPATGEVTYTPNPDFNGNDSFEYTVCDDATPALCDTAIVNVTVNATNDAPVAIDDNAATNEDTAVTINVLANDSDIDSTIDPASVSISSAPANGTVTID
ncbi:tandem-95 repeat protein, partial [Tenacibaculum sp. IB213877]|uniref:tandem-95 repeat protein n=1 Tax=Tenacibaculum sp. IB213877 TaxID=3097351 RepID=UPI002A5AF782